jgi:hypothetical protein
MWQESILLAFVETVHLVNKHDGALGVKTGARQLGFFDGFADVFDTSQNGTDAQKLGIEGIGHQASNGGFAYPRWAPQNATVRLARFKGQAQRHALAQQMLLTNHLTQSAWPQTLGQRRMRGQ